MKKTILIAIIMLAFWLAAPALAVAAHSFRQTVKPVVHKKRVYRKKRTVVNHPSRMQKQLTQAEYHEPRVERAEAAQHKANKEKQKIKTTH